MLDTEKKQIAHYKSIHNAYIKHYYDEYSAAYRDEFITRPLFEGLALNQRKVLYAMCGAGASTQFLLDHGASITGLDISIESIKQFKSRWSNCQAINGSILDMSFPDESFDCVIGAGGIHHVHPNVEEAIEEIHRVLKKGGHFCFYEPHSGSLPDLIRKIWYRWDPYFEDNEEALHIENLKQRFSKQFHFARDKYAGNIAYLLIINSLIFRIPFNVKKLIYRPLFALERLMSRFQGKASSCIIISQWRKIS
jgi:ubiquinone/menaquinone biosynthesis C-methylase UbiE